MRRSFRLRTQGFAFSVAQSSWGGLAFSATTKAGTVATWSWAGSQREGRMHAKRATRWQSLMALFLLLLTLHVQANSGATPPAYMPGTSSENTRTMVIGSDDRAKVLSTTVFPWRTIVRLEVTFPDGTTGGASGALVSEHHVLTARHCVHDDAYGGDAVKMEVVPALAPEQGPWEWRISADSAFSTHTMPYYHAWMTQIHLSNESCSDLLPPGAQCDWAVIALDRNVGNWTNYMYRKCEDCSTGFYKGKFSTAGYPSDLDALMTTMYTCSGNGVTCNCSAGQHYTDLDAAAGQSGSPVWSQEENPLGYYDYYIVSVLKGQHVFLPVEEGARLTCERITEIDSWIAQDASPTDYADLLPGAPGECSYEPLSPSPGGPFKVTCRIYNVGTKASEECQATFALAGQSSTPALYQLGSTTVPPIPPFEYADITCWGTVPVQIASDSSSYFAIQVEVDSAHTVDELQSRDTTAETNNKGFVAQLVEIEKPPLPFVDVALVIDRSGSMADANKLPVAQSAAGYFVDASQAGDQLAVSAFDSTGLLVAPLTLITNSDPNDAVKMGIKTGIDTLVPGDTTNFGAGLQIAYDELLTSTKAQRKAAILMSNGQHNTGTYDGQVQAFAATHWPIYTIGLGSDVNEGTLKQIALDTGGKYYSATTTNLTAMYDLVRADLVKQSLLAVQQWLLGPGQSVTQWLPAIGAGTSQLQILMGWGGSAFEFVLLTPDGREITPAEAALDPNIEYYEQPTYAYYIVHDPLSGSWGVRITGIDVLTPEIVTLNVTASGPILFTLFGYKGHYGSGEPIDLAVQLQEMDGPPILDAAVHVAITKPLGGSAEVVLADDGTHDDGDHDDGIYGGKFTDTWVDGLYGVEFVATGTSSMGPLSERILATILVGELPVVPRPCSPVFQDGFEGAQANRWVSYGLWHLTDNAQCVTPGYSSPTHAWYYGQDDSCNYSTSGANQGGLTSPAIDISGVAPGAQFTVGWSYWREVEYFSEPGYDKTAVLISFDGRSWTEIWKKDSADMSEGGWHDVETATDTNGVPIVAPPRPSSLWIRFAFDTEDAYSNQYTGWLVDDVRVCVGGFSITGPCPLPDGAEGRDYGPVEFGASGGVPPYTLTATGLPAGLELATCLIPAGCNNPGAIVGMPAAGTGGKTYQVTIAVTDATGDSTSRACDLTIAPSGCLCVLLNENFSDASDWMMNELWHVTSGASCLACQGLTGPYAYFGREARCNYDMPGERVRGALTSPLTSVPDCVKTIAVEFDQFRHVESYADGLYDKTWLEVAFDDATWETLWYRDAKDPSPECGHVQVGCDVPEWATHVRLRFRFDTVDKLFNGYPGWAVDNVTVKDGGCVPNYQPTGFLTAHPEALPRDLEGLVSVVNIPNPVRDVDTTTFVVRGIGVEAIKIQIFDLSERLVFEGEADGTELVWHTMNDLGEYLANGVYFYRALVRVEDTWVTTTFQKLVILR